jgi:phage regulator Rha-like protein
MDAQVLVTDTCIEKTISLIRGRKVILDADLAVLYGVSTKRLNEQVKRNKARFPQDFLFQLSPEETDMLMRSRSQFATLKRGQNIKYQPFAFTEHGAIMAASGLNSAHAIEMSIFVVRAFVRLREVLAGHKQLAEKLRELEQKYDSQFMVVFDAIRALMNEPEKPKRTIGFAAKEKREAYAVKR